ncbi:hypothetical protein GQ53DRAFT_703213, partial [Thozetella sp. PMI_491]
MSASTKRACDACTRRKVRCDKLHPCSTCSKTQKECIYSASLPSRRHRKRAADSDILSKLSEYEELMRKHNIKFTPLDNSWIPSALEEKLVSTPPLSYTSYDTRVSSGSSPAESGGPDDTDETKTRPSSVPCEGARIWFALPKDLREPPIDQLTWPGSIPRDNLTESGSRTMALHLMPFHPPFGPALLGLHPEPKHIFKLWQLFADNVNPLTKVVHAPSLQQRITDASWNLEEVDKPLEAIMFAIYALAITAIKAPDCMEYFGETKAALLSKYRSAAAQALGAANLQFTRDFEVLQALVLFILIEPRSELGVTMTSLAVRIGHKMALHRIATSSQLTFFEQEMRVRVWWQIRSLEARARKVLGLVSTRGDFGDTRMPLNINDGEMHPRMTTRPVVEHDGATEMLYCRMKIHIQNWVYTSPTVSVHFKVSPLELIISTDPKAIATKRKAYEEIREIYEDRFLRYCDLSIPLHYITATVARLSLHRMIFWCFHPMHQPNKGRDISPHEQDEVFESSIRILELEHQLRETQFATQLIEHMTAKTQVDALVYMISELRLRTSGRLVNAAWGLVEKMFLSHPELLQEDARFYTALADLTLEAWEARRRGFEAHGAEDTPGFIRMIQEARGNISLEEAAAAAAAASGRQLPETEFQVVWTLDDTFDWSRWSGFPAI